MSISGATTRPSEMASLAERMVYLQGVRVAFAALVLTAAAFSPDLFGIPVGQVLTLSAIYVGVAAAGEALRRLSGTRGLLIVTAGLMVDGVFLAWLAYVTGGVHSPLRFLVYVHLIAVTILASYRAGLKIALWHSLLIFGVVYLQNAGFLHRIATPLLPITESTASFQRLSVLNVTAFWAVALGAATVSSINERELRRRKLDFQGLAHMAAELENSTDPEAIAAVTVDRVGEHFRFGRSALIAFNEEGSSLLASRECASLDELPYEADEVVKSAIERVGPLLIRHLDPATNPSLSALLPDSRNVMVMPLAAEGQPVGVLVLENNDGRVRVSRQVVAMIGQFASHAGLALRNARLMETVQRMAETDPLTGVANRRVFENTLERELSRATRSADQVTLVMLDVDHFKSFNDTFGHQAGDEVLRGVAASVGAQLRHFDLMARYGGEEFAVILPECSAEEAGLVAERLRQAVSDVQGPKRVTASGGVATFPADATSAETLIKAADDALYASKGAGRDRVTLFRRLAESQSAAEEIEISQAAGRWTESKRGKGDVVPRTDLRSVTLARAGASLTAAQTSADVFDAVMESAVTLLGDLSDVQVLLAAGSPLEVSVVSASGSRVAAGHVISLHGQPDPLVTALVEHRSVEGSLSAERAAAWGLDPAPKHSFAIPLVVQSNLAGTILIGSETLLDEQSMYTLEVLGAKATVALERLALKSDLVTIEKKFTSLIQSSSDGISIIDVEGVVRYQTPAVERLLGYRGDELIGTDFTDLVHPDDAVSALRFTSMLLNAGAGDVEGEWRMRRYDGTFVYVQVRGRNLLEDPDLNGLVLTLTDVTERKALQEEVSLLSSRDLLTNLGNRPFFLEHLDEALAAEANEIDPLSVLLLDLDDFKIVNDSLGPEAGDDLIVEVAERLRRCLRAQDSLARLGGDEFAILLRDTNGVGGVTNVAERMEASLRTPFRLRKQEVFISASIGIAIYEEGQSAAELLRNADVAMHMAKQVHKGGHCVFEPSMHEAAVERLQMSSDLQGAIEQKELRLVYQPVVDMTTGEIVAAEALVRWQHPRRGLVSPSEFITLAEETGLILPLGRWVLDQVADKLEAWRSRFPNRELAINVNLSVIQLQEEGFVDEVAALIEAHDLDPSNLVLEITESVLMEDAEDILRRLGQLKALGVRLALDDFGTGYSSLGYLRRFEVDILKIDRSFVNGLGSEPGQAELLDAIIRMGHSLKMTTLAEGIEDRGQLEMLRGMGCDLGQGFLFSRPTEVEDIEELVTRPVENVG